MTDSDKRPTLVLAGLLAGLIAGLLTIVVPSLIGRLGLPIAIFTGTFVGDIFGVVIAVYFWIFLGERSAWRLLGFVLASTAAYIAAMFATIYSAMAMPLSRGGPWASTGTDVSVGGFLIGGAVGGFVVFLGALICFSERKLSRTFLTALELSPVGAILGGLGWAAGPSLGNPILHVIGETVNPYTNAQAACSYSLFLVWQAGMGLTLGWLFSREPVAVPASSAPAPASSAPAPVVGSNRVARIARIALFAAAALVSAFIARTEFPRQYQSAEWQRAYKKHVAERPPMPPQPAERPSMETLPNQLPERPSLENLPEVQPVAPQKMLILHQFGEYVPGDVRPEPIPKAPATTWYGVRYAIPGPSTLGKTGPVVNVQVTEYPNAAWARYKIFQHANGIDLANSTRAVKFGNRIYGQATETAEGRHGFYTWRSGNRLIALWFYSADPDEILKAYLERFPSSEMRPTENPPSRPPEAPSLENLREVQLLAPKQMLILHQFGEYVPGDVRAGKTLPPQNFKTSTANGPATQHYSVKYTVPDAPLFAGRFRPTVEVHVEEYPNAAWAQYEIFQHAPGLALGNSARSVKFGSLIYGGATDAARGQNGSYIWASRNRLISLSFDLAEPDEILEAYLKKFPPPEKASMEDQREAEQAMPQQMLVLHQFGEYVPQRPYSGTTVQPPVAKYYSVRYALPGAPTMGNTGSVVDVQLYEYPNAAWAQYEIFEQGGQTNLANPARPVKFGSRIYGQAKATATGQNGEYVWASGNRLIVMRFYFSEPDEVLKAYLERFPPSSADRL